MFVLLVSFHCTLYSAVYNKFTLNLLPLPPPYPEHIMAYFPWRPMPGGLMPGAYYLNVDPYYIDKNIADTYYKETMDARDQIIK